MSKNPFVDYLNSLHNGNTANQNAIGEMQISSPYFATTQVVRPLVEFLKDKVQKGCFIILTGHAGDGKTTLLAQVFEALGHKMTVLESSGDVDCGTATVHYIKDFSELTKEQQDSELTACFHREGSSVLIANTGPLLGAFNRLDENDYESILLDAMDKTSGSTLSISNYGDVFILNIARVDNTDFIRPYLNNLLDWNHWSECESCACAAKCPMYINRNLLLERYERSASFIENVYTWLQEYDHRATIRQITAHLTYSITGGLNCLSVERHASDDWRYRYLTSNLFFGCEGVRFRGTAKQIRGIQLVNDEAFDQKPTSIDYDLFTKQEFKTLFPTKLAEIFDNAFCQHRYCDPSEMQTILKRAFLFFGQVDSEKSHIQQKETFSEWFELYLRICRNGEKPKEYLKSAICTAINALFVGELLGESADHIDLTLRRNNEQTSNVQLLSGRVSIDNVSLKTVPFDTVSGQKQYKLMFSTGNVSYQIRLPLLNYFYEIYKGIIITDIDPVLSNGIDSLKAQLLSDCAKASDPNEVPLVYLSGSRWLKRKIIIGAHSIDHD